MARIKRPTSRLKAFGKLRPGRPTFAEAPAGTADVRTAAYIQSENSLTARGVRGWTRLTGGSSTSAAAALFFHEHQKLFDRQAARPNEAAQRARRDFTVIRHRERRPTAVLHQDQVAALLRANCQPSRPKAFPTARPLILGSVGIRQRPRPVWFRSSAAGRARRGLPGRAQWLRGYS